MALGIKVKEKIARTIGTYFTTSEISAVFKDAHIATDESLYAKWRITLDAFSKTSRDDTLFHIICEFCHPLNFEDLATRQKFIDELNVILAYEELKVVATERTAEISSINIGGYLKLANADVKTSIDFVIEAINHFKNEYNKVRISGLEYEYSLGENYEKSNGDLDDAEEHSGRLKAIEQLKNIGFITEYTIEERVENEGYYVWDYAICKIDERKINQKEEPQATDAGVEALTKKIIHEHTHRFENSIQEKEIAISIDDKRNASKAKNKFPHPIPAGTEWRQVSMKVLGDEKIHIKLPAKEHTATYEEMGFGKHDGKPSVLWAFFKILAMQNGEIAITDETAKVQYKKQKQQVSDILKNYFSMESDPFHPYKENNSYKTRFTLFSDTATEKDRAYADDKKGQDDRYSGIGEYMEDIAPTL
jgi:hypothetical protein